MVASTTQRSKMTKTPLLDRCFFAATDVPVGSGQGIKELISNPSKTQKIMIVT